MKNNRQQVIIKLINGNEIETQDDLISLLEGEGYKVTQATISRDIRELKISKVLGENGKYHYTFPKNIQLSQSKNTLKHSYSTSIISVDGSENIVVVKTHPGLAQAVATGIDAMHIEGVLGCVAGDDAIIIVAKSREFTDKIIAVLLAEVNAK